ncbi:hypothetical protein N7492_007266 [Penicillium capsulatum]|uniref:SIMPL domain-containing protein n=1 Tax=Penicillium capsulatum TaxID=69766 RepID=A0A9W9I100_9EURO|nr:hypothetical protein N7492_007266 [Penicillium capsulatum]KAJ6117104.1 hypothetical protein N7512_006829 [Penicillium capsulatum]
MAPLTIQIKGASSIAYRPERGALSITVKSQGPEQASVSSEVTSTSNQLNEMFTSLSPKLQSGVATPDAPVTVFSSRLLRTWSSQPTDKNENPLPPVYYATVGFNVVFRNFAKLGETVGQLSTKPNVDIKSIDWTLSEATQKEIGSETRKEAIRNAILKANDYAEVVGREVVPVEIKDCGQRTESSSSQAQGAQQVYVQAPRGMMNQVRETQTGGLDLTPQNIRYTGSVEVKFEAI